MAVIIGELVPRFDIVMGLIGGTLTGPLIFILPPLFYNKILKLESLHDSEVLRQKRLERIIDDDSEDDDGLTVGTYGTFKNRSGAMNSVETISKSCCGILFKYFKLLYSDCVLSISVILFGLGATFASTYFNIANVSAVKEFWSPCIFNTSYSILKV